MVFGIQNRRPMGRREGKNRARHAKARYICTMVWGSEYCCTDRLKNALAVMLRRIQRVNYSGSIYIEYCVQNRAEYASKTRLVAT